MKLHIVSNPNGSITIVKPEYPDAIRIEVSQSEFVRIVKDYQFYILVDNKLIFNPELVDTYPFLTKEEKICDLKTQLSSSDYKVIKCMEASMADELPPYDAVAIHREREAIRSHIRFLETGIRT